VPTLVFEGDFHQLPPPVNDPKCDARFSTFWNLLNAIELVGQHRSSDNGLTLFAKSIRLCRPNQDFIDQHLESCMIGNQLTEEVVHAAWASTPNVMILAATRATVATVNAFALAFFGGLALSAIPVWVDTLTCMIVFRHGNLVRITRNHDVDQGICNGRCARIVGVLQGGVVLDMGNGCIVLPQRVAWIGNQMVSGFDLELGYCTTVHKVEGMTLDKAVVIFERYAPAGWAYTALTRVRSRGDLSIVGWPRPFHFTPRELTSVKRNCT